MGNEVKIREPSGKLDKFAPGPVLLALEGRGEFPEVDTAAMRERMNQALLEATSADELISAGKAWSLQDLLGRPMEVNAAVPRPSRIEGDGLAGFLIMDVTMLDDGQRLIVTTSAENVCVRVAIAADRGWLPIQFKVRKADAATERGFFPLLVESV